MLDREPPLASAPVRTRRGRPRRPAWGPATIVKIRPRATGFQWPLRGHDTIDVTDREGRLLDTFEAAPVLHLIREYVELRRRIMASGPLKRAGRHLFAAVAVVPMLRNAPRAWGPRYPTPPKGAPTAPPGNRMELAIGGHSQMTAQNGAPTAPPGNRMEPLRPPT